MRLAAILKQAALTLADGGTLSLIAALVIIMVLESVMRRSGMLEAMTGSIFLLRWNPGVLTASIPAIIGFLPSAGGARFSAPLVERAMAGMPYRAEEKVFVNYWFRHIWEYSLPLYPGLILAAQLSGLPLGRLILWMWPFSVAWALLGYWIVFRGKKEQISRPAENVPAGHAGPQRGPLALLAANTWPIWATVVLVVAHVPIVAALLGVLTVLAMVKKYPLGALWRTLREPMTAGIVLLIWGVLAFKDVLQASGAVAQVSGIFVSSGWPPFTAAVVLPFMAGILTGVVPAGIGVSFPLVMALSQPAPAYVMLAYVSGVVGVMLSPVHLCFILTNDYFRADFIKSYRPLIAPGLLVLAGAATLFGLASGREVAAWGWRLLH
jgi:integral membrane protein (TIGR00529 family)